MSKIHSMMDMGRRSMMNSQTSLQTVGHNIANKNTEGYSRQRVEQVTAEPIGQGGLRIGQGSRAAEVTRTNNSYLEKQIGKETANFGYFDAKSQGLSRVEQVYNEQNGKGLNQFVTDFFNAFRELSNNPESLATRNLVKETADHLSKDFKRVNTQLNEIQNDLDQQIATSVSDINSYTREIANLNEKVQQVEVTGAKANDERDRRDLLIKKLGEKVNIRWAEGRDSMVTISAGDSALLVSGYDHKDLSVMATPESDTKGEGNFDVFYKNSDAAVPMKVTEQFTGGTLGALLEVRDTTINGLKGKMDDLAFSLADEVNAGHMQGFDTYNKQGEEFFVIPGGDVKHASSTIEVSDEIKNDVNRIAAAGDANSPGDNRVANYISQLQYEKIAGDGAATVDEFYNSSVGEVGISAQRANTARDSQRDILRQLSNIRESVSGVSLDEETTKMIEFQKAFDASARLIKTADEMFDTVLNLKRL